MQLACVERRSQPDNDLRGPRARLVVIMASTGARPAVAARTFTACLAWMMDRWGLPVDFSYELREVVHKFLNSVLQLFVILCQLGRRLQIVSGFVRVAANRHDDAH